MKESIEPRKKRHRPESEKQVHGAIAKDNASRNQMKRRHAKENRCWRYSSYVSGSDGGYLELTAYS